MAPQLTSRLTYPNPFSPSGIAFDLPEKARVTLKIFDEAGKEVRTLIENQSLDPGTRVVDPQRRRRKGNVFLQALRRIRG